jgi:hypothetical protein
MKHSEVPSDPVAPRGLGASGTSAPSTGASGTCAPSTGAPGTPVASGTSAPSTGAPDTSASGTSALGTLVAPGTPVALGTCAPLSPLVVPGDPVSQGLIDPRFLPSMDDMTHPMMQMPSSPELSPRFLQFLERHNPDMFSKDIRRDVPMQLGITESKHDSPFDTKCTELKHCGRNLFGMPERALKTHSIFDFIGKLKKRKLTVSELRALVSDEAEFWKIIKKYAKFEFFSECSALRELNNMKSKLKKKYKKALKKFCIDNCRPEKFDDYDKLYSQFDIFAKLENVQKIINQINKIKFMITAWENYIVKQLVNTNLELDSEFINAYIKIDIEKIEN